MRDSRRGKRLGRGDHCLRRETRGWRDGRAPGIEAVMAGGVVGFGIPLTPLKGGDQRVP